jgi:predicted nucleic acid-binding protein
MKQMKGRAFIDTNILVYIYSTEKEKQNTILTLFENLDEIVISQQVIMEFCNVLTKKFKYPFKHIESAILDFERNFEIVELNINLIKEALKISEKYKFSYYDSLIIISALKNNCNILYSEDLQHNQLINRVLKIINPFKE